MDLVGLMFIVSGTILLIIGLLSLFIKTLKENKKK